MASYFPVPFRIMNLEFPINVVRGCRKREITGPAAGGTMTVRIHSTIVNRAAVEEIRGMLARHYEVPRSAVALVPGSGAGGVRVRISMVNSPAERAKTESDHGRARVRVVASV